MSRSASPPVSGLVPAPVWTKVYGEREVELEARGHAVGEEEVAGDLVVDGVLVAAARTGRRDAEHDRPRQVRRHEPEADLTLGDRLRPTDRREARRARVRPVRVAVDARVDERVRALLRSCFTLAERRGRAQHDEAAPRRAACPIASAGTIPELTPRLHWEMNGGHVLSSRRRAGAPPSRQRVASAARDPDEPSHPFFGACGRRRRVHACRRRRRRRTSSVSSSRSSPPWPRSSRRPRGPPRRSRPPRPSSSRTPPSSTTARSSASPRTWPRPRR